MRIKVDTSVPANFRDVGDFVNHDLPMPLFIHCLSGKDRTGIITGIILKLMNIPMEIIVEEYLLSDGDLQKEMFLHAMEGVGNPAVYFKKLDVVKISLNLSGWFLRSP